MKKRLLSLFLVLVLVMILPVSVLAADALNIVEITGLTLPVEGATPDMSFGVIQSECTVEEVRWMDLSTDTYMSASDTFVYEKDEYGNERNYRLEVHISISDPYTVFADSDNIFVTINGMEAWASIIDDYHLIAEYDFVATPHTCSGGYATCIEPANCSVCGKAYGSPNPENHDIFGYEKDSSHSKYTTHHDVKCDLCKKVFYEEEHCWGPENDKGIRPCIVCWYMPEPKPETHTCSGGYATCVEPAICSTCGKAYGSPNPEHHDIFGYEKSSSHSKYATHHDIKCDLCKKVFGEEEHYWGPENDKGVRPCTVCWYMPEPKPETHTCSGGYATCVEPAICSTCGKAYGSPNPEHHDIFGYEKSSSHSKYTTHHDLKCDLCKKVLGEEEHYWGPENDKGVRLCTVCWYEPEVPSASTDSNEHEHVGGTATCDCGPICEECGEEYGEPDAALHVLTAVKKAEDDPEYATTHDVRCELCEEIVGEEEHTFGEANHMGVTPCIVCWYVPELEVEEHECSGGYATCTETAICSICGKEYGEIDENAHRYLETWGLCDSNGHAKNCIACGKPSAYEDHVVSEENPELCGICGYSVESHECSGGKATCCEKAICTVCGKEYGEIDENAHRYLDTWGLCDSNGHAKNCVACSKLSAYEDHVVSEENPELCGICGYPVEASQTERKPMSKGAIVAVSVGGAAVVGGASAGAVFVIRKRRILK